MDRGKRPGNFTGIRNNKMYMDLKDIIREEALRFLPAKSLFSCQGVCRDWKHQISIPFFAHNQSLSFHAISGMFGQKPGVPPVFISIDPKSYGVPDPALEFLPVPVDIRSSSNGLLCCRGCAEDKAYYVCNPATKQFKKLPKPNADHGSDPAVVLVFEPSRLNFMMDYKLICAFPSADFDDATEFEIYSSKNGSWEVSGEICFAMRMLVPRSGFHANGVVYWKVKHGGILAFDLTKSRSQRMQSYFSSNGCLGMVDGKLCMASMHRHALRLNVLTNVHSNTMHMKNSTRMWEEKTVCLDAALIATDVLSLEGDCLLLQNRKRVYYYDLKTKEGRDLGEAPNHDVHWFSYVNSLVSL